MSGEWVDAAALVFRFGLAFVFLAAAVPKLLGPHEFERAVANYRLLPASLVRPVSVWLPRVELACALALLLGIAVTPVAFAAASLLVGFALAVAANLIRGRAINCGCQGSVAPRQIGWALVTADLALAAMAVAAAIVNPNLFGVGLLDSSARASSLSSQQALAMLLLAAFLVLAELLQSDWLELRAAAQAFRTRASESTR